jgi:hypothetical protein
MRGAGSFINIKQNGRKRQNRKEIRILKGNRG